MRQLVPVTADLISYLHEIGKPRTANWLIGHPEVTAIEQEGAQGTPRVRVFIPGMSGDSSECDRWLDGIPGAMFVLDQSLQIGMSSPSRGKVCLDLYAPLELWPVEVHYDRWLAPFNEAIGDWEISKERIGTMTLLTHDPHTVTVAIGGAPRVFGCDLLSSRLPFRCWLTAAAWQKLREQYRLDILGNLDLSKAVR